MEYHLIPHCLPGYPDSRSIRIVYDIPAGIQVRSKWGSKSALMCLDPLPLPWALLICFSLTVQGDAPSKNGAGAKRGIKDKIWTYFQKVNYPLTSEIVVSWWTQNASSFLSLVSSLETSSFRRKNHLDFDEQITAVPRRIFLAPTASFMSFKRTWFYFCPINL